jgi:AraC-like DNA-binding protein
LNACKEALTDPAYNRQRISEIAFRRGFNSTSHFCRAFKEKYGASPGEVRRTMEFRSWKRRCTATVGPLIAEAPEPKRKKRHYH